MVAVVLPTLAYAADDPSLVSVSPEWQASNGKRDVTIDVTVADGATSTCELFNGDASVISWSPCQASYSFSPKVLDDGSYRLRASARLDGARDTAVSDFVIDSVVPEVVHSTKYPELVTGKFYTSWWLKKKEPVPPTFEVEQRVDSPFSGLGDWKTRARSTDKHSLDFVPEQGETICVRVRATDQIGQTGPWSRDICRTRYLDDRKLEGWRGTRDWDAITFNGNYESTALISKSEHAKLWLPTDRVSELLIRGRKGPYGGTIELRIGGDLVERIDLKAPDAKAATIFNDSFRVPKTGRLTLEVVSPDGRYVHLDMLVLRR
jgi:hypothetical protein